MPKEAKDLAKVLQLVKIKTNIKTWLLSIPMPTSNWKSPVNSAVVTPYHKENATGATRLIYDFEKVW